MYNAQAIRAGVRASALAEDARTRVEHIVEAIVIGLITKTEGWWIFATTLHGLRIRIDDSAMPGLKSCFIGRELVNGTIDESFINQEVNLFFDEGRLTAAHGIGQRIKLTFAYSGPMAQFYAGKQAINIISIETIPSSGPYR